MSEGRVLPDQGSTEVIEPTDGEKDAARAARTFWRSCAEDTTALGIAAFATVAFVVVVVVIMTFFGENAAECGEQDYL